MFIPYLTKIQVEPVKKDTMLMSDQKDYQEMGKVIAVGSKVKFVKKGDLLYFTSWGVDKTPEVDGKSYYVVEESSAFILGKESNGPKKSV
jgi:co-chaperonin GroES (HSP10)